MKRLNLNIDDCALDVQIDAQDSKPRLRTPKNLGFNFNQPLQASEPRQNNAKPKKVPPQIMVADDDLFCSNELANSENYLQLLKPASPNRIEASSIGIDPIINNLSENSDQVGILNSHTYNPASWQNTPKDSNHYGSRNKFQGLPKEASNYYSTGKRRESDNDSNMINLEGQKLLKKSSKPPKNENLLFKNRFAVDGFEKQFTPKVSSSNQNKFFRFDINLPLEKKTSGYQSLSCKNGPCFTRVYKPIDLNFNNRQLGSNKNSQKQLEVKMLCRTPKSLLANCASPNSVHTSSIRKQLKLSDTGKQVPSPKMAQTKEFKPRARKMEIDIDEINNEPAEIKPRTSITEHGTSTTVPAFSQKPSTDVLKPLSIRNANPSSKMKIKKFNNFTIDTDFNADQQVVDELVLKAPTTKNYKSSFEQSKDKIESPAIQFEKTTKSPKRIMNIKPNLNLVIEENENELMMQNSYLNVVPDEKVPKSPSKFLRTQKTEMENKAPPIDAKIDRILKDQKLKTDNYKRMLESKVQEIAILQQKLDDMYEQNLALSQSCIMQKDLAEFYMAKAHALESQIKSGLCVQSPEFKSFKPTLSKVNSGSLQTEKNHFKKFLAVQNEVPNLTCSQPVSPSGRALLQTVNKSLTPTNFINPNPGPSSNTPHPTYFKFDSFGNPDALGQIYGNGQCAPMLTSKAAHKPGMLFGKNTTQEAFWSATNNNTSIPIYSSEGPKIHQINTITNNININIKETQLKTNIDNVSKRVNNPFNVDGKAKKKDHLKIFTPKNASKSSAKMDPKNIGTQPKNLVVSDSYTKEKEKNINLELHKFRNNFLKSNNTLKNSNTNSKELIGSNAKMPNFSNGSFYAKANSSTKGPFGHVVKLLGSIGEAVYLKASEHSFFNSNWLRTSESTTGI